MEAKSNIYIKQLTKEDVINNFDDISKLLQESYEVSFNCYNIETDYFDSRIRKLINYILEGKAIVFGAFGNKLVGFIWCYPHLFLNEKRLHINHFVVSSTLRGLGIGSILMKQAEKYATNNNIKNIDLMVTAESPSVRFYKQDGFLVERYQMIKRL